MESTTSPTEATATTEAATAPAGWHPDPHDPTRSRYWDGNAWSDYVSPDNLSVELMEGAAPPSPVASVAQRIGMLALTVAALALLVLYGAWRGGADDDPSPSFAAPEPRSEPESSRSEPDPSTFMPSPPGPIDANSDYPPENVVDGVYFPTIAIRYRSENNNGVVTETLTAFDPPLSVRRDGDGSMVLNDGEFITNCSTNNHCRRFPRSAQGPQLMLSPGAGILDPADLERRTIAGVEADCSHGVNGDLRCWSVDHHITLLEDPGDEAMQPGVFTTRRLTAVEVRPPTATDFELPPGATIEER